MKGAHVRQIGDRFMGEYEASLPGQARRRRSAGMFGSQSEALSAAMAMRAKVLAGEPLTDFNADTTVDEFAPYFLRTALIGERTRADYTGTYDLYIAPYFTGVPFAQLERPRKFKEWRAELVRVGVPDPTIRKAKVILSSLITAATEEDCLHVNHVRALKVRKGQRRTIDIIDLDEFDRLWHALELESRRLFLELAIEIGPRPGELYALTPEQLDRESGAWVTIDRAVTVPGRKWSKSGDRFDIKGYPKDGTDRTVVLAPDLMARLWSLIERHGIGTDHIIFNPTVMGVRRPTAAPEAVEPGESFTAPNGRTYRHGSNTGYTMGKCREDCCKAAHSEAARRVRASKPKQQRAPQVDILAPETWRSVFYRALDAASITLDVTPRHMRHTHASWRLDRGENLLDVMEDMGHSDSSVTKHYRVRDAHALPSRRLVTPAASA